MSTVIYGRDVNGKQKVYGHARSEQLPWGFFRSISEAHENGFSERIPIETSYSTSIHQRGARWVR
tara:strand:- start:14 stop:208 length:195 start_codon:yes stop_codon:yes gene_type:complete